MGGREEISFRLLEHVVKEHLPKDVPVFREKGKLVVYTLTDRFVFDIHDDLFSIYEECLRIWKSREVELAVVEKM